MTEKMNSSNQAPEENPWDSLSRERLGELNPDSYEGPILEGPDPHLNERGYPKAYRLRAALEARKHMSPEELQAKNNETLAFASEEARQEREREYKIDEARREADALARGVGVPYSEQSEAQRQASADYDVRKQIEAEKEAVYVRAALERSKSKV